MQTLCIALIFLSLGACGKTSEETKISIVKKPDTSNTMCHPVLEVALTSNAEKIFFMFEARVGNKARGFTHYFNGNGKKQRHTLSKDISTLMLAPCSEVPIVVSQLKCRDMSDGELLGCGAVAISGTEKFKIFKRLDADAE